MTSTSKARKGHFPSEAGETRRLHNQTLASTLFQSVVDINGDLRDRRMHLLDYLAPRDELK